MKHDKSSLTYDRCGEISKNGFLCSRFLAVRSRVGFFCWAFSEATGSSAVRTSASDPWHNFSVRSAADGFLRLGTTNRGREEAPRSVIGTLGVQAMTRWFVLHRWRLLLSRALA